MADRTSARLFGRIFEQLARESEKNKDFAEWLWDEAKGYDFCSYQMDCDDALLALGLASMCHEEVLYLDDGECGECERVFTKTK